MATFPIGIQTRSLRLPLRRALESAAEMGAQGVEIDARNEFRAADLSQTGLRQFRKLLDDLGLRVSSIAFPTRRGLDDPDQLERRLLAVSEAMVLAYKLGASVVTGQAGAIEPWDEQGGDVNTTLVESLTMLSARAERVGARYAFASGASPEDQRALLDRFSEGAIGVALHPGLMIRRGGDPERAAAMLGGRTLAVYAADAVREGPSRTSEVALGRGEADLPAVLARLEEHDYRGAVTLERSEGDDPRRDLENGVAYLRSL